MADQRGQEVLRRLIGTMRCSVCRRHFDRRQVRIAARDDQFWIVTVRCSMCRNHQMFWVSLESNQAEPIISDLTEREAARFETMEPVSSDDVLDMHLALKDFEGTPEELLG